MNESERRRASPLAPVSWGEFIDKITILEIKLEKITAAPALENVARELTYLNRIYDADATLVMDVSDLKLELRRVNEALWLVEDTLRAKEKCSEFDEDFIQYARSVYRLNDQRAQLKRDINLRLRSDLIEEKSYDQPRS